VKETQSISMGDLPARKARDLQAKKRQMITMSQVPDATVRRSRQQIYKVNRKLGDVLKDGAWKGSRCFIIGGGESVKDFDLKKLEGEHTIGINLAFRLFDPEIIFGMDARLWGWIENDETAPGDKAKFDACPAIKVWSDISSAPLPEDIVLAPSICRPGMSKTTNEGLGCGTNSGFGALNLALLLGASEIYLIGFDFYGDRWHAGYPQHGEAGNDYHKTCYEEHSAEIAGFPSRIINLNPKSCLKIFEFGKLPEDLASAPVRTAALPTVERMKSEGEPIFVNYYTPDNGYKAYADNLRTTLMRLNLDFDIQPIRNRGDWDTNTKFKPEFILKMLDAHPGRPVVWLDADAVVVSLPEKLLRCKADFACRIRETGELISSVMFFANNEVCRELLKAAQKLIDTGEKRSFGEQKFIEEAVVKWRKKKSFKFENLPESYCCIMGISKLNEDPVIEQHQASRSLKT
jgi:hypothetical protein